MSLGGRLAFAPVRVAAGRDASFGTASSWEAPGPETRVSQHNTPQCACLVDTALRWLSFLSIYTSHNSAEPLRVVSARKNTRHSHQQLRAIHRSHKQLRR